MVGEEDPITPPEFSDTIAAELDADHLKYIKFENCGHGVILDKPDEALEALRELISTVSAKHG